MTVPFLGTPRADGSICASPFCENTDFSKLERFNTQDSSRVSNPATRDVAGRGATFNPATRELSNPLTLWPADPPNYRGAPGAVIPATPPGTLVPRTQQVHSVSLSRGAMVHQLRPSDCCRLSSLNSRRAEAWQPDNPRLKNLRENNKIYEHIIQYDIANI